MRAAPGALLAALALAAAGAGADAPSSPWPAPLTLAGDGPYYTLRVPMALQSAAAREDLGDLRVRNASGETMPQAWLPERGDSNSSSEVTATIYKVPMPARAASAPAAPQSWIIDTIDAGFTLERLRLKLAPDTRGVFSLQVEASDDLQRWRLVQPAAQVVQLAAPERADRAEPLRATEVDLAATPARYLRLSTAAGAPIPELEGATVRHSSSHVTLERSIEWSAAIAPASCDDRHCDYALPRNVPLELLQIVLAEPDTVSPFTLLVKVDTPAAIPERRRHLLHGSWHALRGKERAAPADPGWAWIAETDAWWLRNVGGVGDLRSPAVPLDAGQHALLRLQAASTMRLLGPSPPTVRIGAHPATLVFLARGPGPFRLELAPADDSPTTMTIAQLMPMHRLEDPLPVDSATPLVRAGAAAVARASAPARATSSSTRMDAPWLWAALLAGVGLMGAMAWSLLRKR